MVFTVVIDLLIRTTDRGKVCRKEGGKEKGVLLFPISYRLEGYTFRTYGTPGYTKKDSKISLVSGGVWRCLAVSGGVRG